MHAYKLGKNMCNAYALAYENKQKYVTYNISWNFQNIYGMLAYDTI